MRVFSNLAYVFAWRIPFRWLVDFTHFGENIGNMAQLMSFLKHSAKIG